MPVTGWNPLGLNSAGLPVPHQGTTCAWTSMAQVGASEFGHWQAFGFLAASNFPNTPTPRGGGTKKIRISHFARVCVLLGARSLKRLGLVIVTAYPPSGGRCP